MNPRTSVCVVLVDRANYGRLKPVMRAIQAEPGLDLQVIAAGTMVLERFGMSAEVVRQDGFPIDAEVYMELEGGTPATMAKSLGFGIVEFAGTLQRLRPSIVIVIGDRYEALAAAIATAYMNICMVHIQGGEVSGSIDESARHAITKLAHFHVPSTKVAAEYLVRMGERPDTILTVGCPSSDLARELDMALPPEVLNGTGAGAWIDAERPFLLAVFHPTTTEYGDERAQMEALLASLDEMALPTVLLWPNIDAGADHISKAIRVFRAQTQPAWLRTLTNLAPDDYLRVLARASCAVGNSSSFVRDAGYFGTPVVLVGNRQEGREIGPNTIPAPAEMAKIVRAVRRQLDHGRHPASSLYGDGHVSARVTEALLRLKPYSQKRLNYIHDAALVGAAE